MNIILRFTTISCFFITFSFIQTPIASARLSHITGNALENHKRAMENHRKALLKKNKPKIVIGIDEAKRLKIPTEGNITKVKNGAVAGNVTIVLTQCTVSWAGAGYCLAGVTVAIMIADALNGVNPIAPGSGLDTLSTSLDKALGKPGAKIKNGLSNAGGAASDTGKKIIDKITKPFRF